VLASYTAEQWVVIMERCHILSSQYVRLSRQDIWISLIIWVISSLGLAFYEKHLQATIYEKTSSSHHHSGFI